MNSENNNTITTKFQYLEELSSYGITKPTYIDRNSLIEFAETDTKMREVIEEYITKNDLSKVSVFGLLAHIEMVYGKITQTDRDSKSQIETPLVVVRFPIVITGAGEICATGLLIHIATNYINLNYPRVDPSIGTDCIVDARFIEDVIGATIERFVSAKEIASRSTYKFFIVSNKGFIYNAAGRISIKIIRTLLPGMKRHMEYAKDILTAVEKFKSIDTVPLKDTP